MTIYFTQGRYEREAMLEHFYVWLTATLSLVQLPSGGFFIFLWQQTNRDWSSWQRSALLEYFIIPGLSPGITDGLPDITINYTPLLSSAVQTKLNQCSIIWSQKVLSWWELISHSDQSVKIVKWLSAPNCLYILLR